jgi:hypothetical protein
MSTTTIGPGDERVGGNEDALIAQITGKNLETLNERGKPTQRAQHPKPHGCAKAVFEIRADVPPELRQGVFAAPRRFDALIRFSNGLQTDDREADAHGMAIKLLDVPGRKLLPGNEDSTTMDFVLVDHPVFFSTDLDEYATFNEHFGNIIALARNEESDLKKFLGTQREKLVLAAKELDLVLRLRKFASQTPVSPLATHYWSTTPSRLGGHAVKYMAATDRAAADGAQAGVEDAEGLAAALSADLLRGPATYTFGVHVQRDPVAQPVEDPTVPWWPADDADGRRSMVALATIEITGMAERSEVLAEHLVFSPWNVLDQHRPLGAINRARREVYRRLATERQRRNEPLPEGFSPGSVEVPTPRA